MNSLAKKFIIKIMHVISYSTEMLKWWRPYKQFADLNRMLPNEYESWKVWYILSELNLEGALLL